MWARNRGQALEALPLVFEVARAAHQHAMLDVVVDAREDGAGSRRWHRRAVPWAGCRFHRPLRASCAARVSGRRRRVPESGRPVGSPASPRWWPAGRSSKARPTVPRDRPSTDGEFRRHGRRLRRVVVRVPSWANSVVVIGVRIHALLAGKPRRTRSLFSMVWLARTRAQAQQCSGQQVGDFLDAGAGAAVRRRGNGDGFEFGHGRRFDGKRCSCYEPKALRVTCFSGSARGWRYVCLARYQSCALAAHITISKLEQTRFMHDLPPTAAAIFRWQVFGEPLYDPASRRGNRCPSLDGQLAAASAARARSLRQANPPNHPGAMPWTTRS